MEFYQDEQAQQAALDSLGALLDDGVPAHWIVDRINEARMESLCHRVLLEVGLLSLEGQQLPE